ncbi:hypothetical protein [Lonepinella sp. BR2474]|uniref:hypothetical protein n=1 Tax=Lonepinella sp. BR2474 TaxID=3434548 RepID=UPI003F6E419E
MKTNLLLLILLTLGLSACSITRQPIEKASLLTAGMTESEVNNILGNPIMKRTNGRGSYAQWCKTGIVTPITPIDFDNYLIAFFYDSKLVGTRDYTENTTDARYGDCSALYHEIEWIPSPTKTEYKLKEK